MRFVVVDVETANPQMSSICQIGVVGFDGRGELPPTLFDLFFEDLNRKTRSIAISRVIGPDPRGEAEFMQEVRAGRGEEAAAQLRELLDILHSSKNPDEAIRRAENLPIAEFV